MSDEERFWTKVEKTETCWLWTRGLNRGYGNFHGNRKTNLAHRYCYELLKGPIPEGMQLDHLCRTPRCVNPDHLEPVTGLENMKRCPQKTHCPHGHEYSDENTEIRTDDKGFVARLCRTCQKRWKENALRNRRLKYLANKK